MTERLNVLVVDDSASMRMLIVCVLNAAGHHALQAGGVKDALRLMRCFRPDVIVTDYAMPVLDGHDLVRLVRRSPRLFATPIFVVSSEDAWEKRQLMDLAGVSAWLPKPLDPRALLGAVAAVARMAPTSTFEALRPVNMTPVSPLAHRTMARGR